MANLPNTAGPVALPHGESPPALYKLTTKQRDLLDASVAIEREDAREVGAVGYAARLWAQLSLPYSNPGDVPDWERRNGSLTLTINPAIIRDIEGKRRGYPYGVLPRYILTWMSSEAVRTQSPVLDLGDSLRDFMTKLGLPSTGGKNGSITRLTDQMRRLLGSTMLVEDLRDSEANRWSIAGEHFTVASSYKLWFAKSDPTGQTALWGSTINLGDKFFQSIVGAPVPVDTRALKALGGSSMRIDLYCWAAHRMFTLRRPQLVPWALLAGQFGSDYKQPHHFRTAVMKQLGAVLAVYPTADIVPTKDGLLLSPSPTPVPRRDAPRAIRSS